jgi:hypothetical protein
MMDSQREEEDADDDDGEEEEEEGEYRGEELKETEATRTQGCR